MRQYAKDPNHVINRRQAIAQATGIAAAGLACSPNALAASANTAITKGRIKQSMAFWCFNVAGDEWTVEQQCRVAKRLGVKSIELVEPTDFATLKKHGLICALTPNGMPGAPFVKGLNNLSYHDEVVTRTKSAMEATAAAGFPNVITFNGFKWCDAEDPTSGEIPLDEGARNCVIGLKKLAKHAEEAGITVCIEMLNTRDDTHPMKGHPGYQGDDMDYVAEIVKQVGSPRVKLLFDIYHVQIMNGDVIRRLRQYAELIGHVHAAGNPGRGELDDNQEINYRACMKTLVDIGYQGYVGQEYIPTGDALEGLIQAVTVCDV